MSKTFIRTLLLLTSLFTLPAFAVEDAVSTGFFNNVTLDGYDTVAYFTKSKPVKGDKKYEFVWRGATWRFVSQQNADLFKQDPTKYAPQYGSFCAWAMSGGKTASVDPEVWHIEDGKLYLNYNKAVQQDWLSTMQADIVAADMFYPKITNVNSYKD